MSKFYLRNFGRTIKICSAQMDGSVKSKTIYGKESDHSHDVRYDNLNELLLFAWEGIIGILALTHKEVIILQNSEDEDGSEDHQFVRLCKEYNGNY